MNGCRILVSFLLCAVTAQVGAAVTRVSPQDAQVIVLKSVPGVPDRVLAGTTVGLFVSEDAGLTWELAGMHGLAVSNLEVAPTDPDRIYAGQSGDWFSTNSQGGVFRSDDGGRTWIEARAGLEHSSSNPDIGLYKYLDVSDLAVDPEDADRVWAVADGVWFSSDGGGHWTQLTDDRGHALSIERDEHGLVLYLGGKGVRRSLDGGQSWHDYSAGLLRSTASQSHLLSVEDLMMVPGDDGTLLGMDNNREIVRLDPQDLTWETVIRTSSTFGPSVMATSDAAPGEVWVGTTYQGLLHSTDSGRTWNLVESADFQCTFVSTFWLPITAISISPVDPDRILLSQYHDLLLTTDRGTSWASSNVGLGAAHVTGIFVDPDNREQMVFSTMGSGIHFSNDGGRTSEEVLSSTLTCDIPSPNPWQVPLPDCWWWSRLIQGFDGALIVSGDCGTFESRDHGSSWQELGDPVAWPVGRASDDSVWYELTDELLRRSGDQGSSWQTCGSLPEMGGSRAKINGVAVHSATPDVAVAGTDRGLLYSADGCQSWQPVGTTNETHYTWSCSPRVASWDTDLYLVEAPCGTNWSSRDQAQTWSQDGHDNQWWEVLIDPKREGVVYAARYSGPVWLSSDGGRTWPNKLSSIPAHVFVQLGMAPDGDTLYVSVSELGAAFLVDLPVEINRHFPNGPPAAIQ